MKSAVAVKSILFLICMTSFVSAQTVWFVDRDNSYDPFEDGSAAHPFNTIQEGVNAALNGDDVRVAEGIYRGLGNKRIKMLGKAITLSSVSGPSNCIIDCEDDGQGFDLGDNETASTLISGFTVINGSAPAGAGIRVVASSPTISNCVIRENHATDKGGGVYANWSSVFIINCAIIGNSASNLGGGVSGGVIVNCTITSNSAMHGGGLYNAFASNCVVSANKAFDFGGGANLGTLRNCTVIGNTADSGGGVCDGSILNCLIISNSANYGGGSIYGTLEDCMITGNSVSNSGGGVSEGVIEDCTITSNSALHGGGLYNTYASNCIICANSVHDLSGFGGGANFGVLRNCLIIDNHANNGGGTVDGLIQDCQIVSNTAVWGGGSAYSTLSNCALTGNLARDGGGGAAYGTLNNCTLSDNSAPSGGGAFGNTLSNCTLTDNSAYSGGGVYDGTLNYCTLSGNSATNGGGAYRSTLDNCTLSGNTVNTYGGGSCYGTLSNCTLLGNSAGFGGGGSYSAALNNCMLSGNSAYYGGGCHHSTLNNCTLSGNSASNQGGGSSWGTLNNCIVYYNTAVGPDYNWIGSTMSYSCTTPDPGGVGNITSGPAFIDYAASNLRLLSNSPCINAGTNQDWMIDAADLDGSRRIVGKIVDMGAYEFQGTSVYYVVQSNAGATPPYTSWETAATSIQDAVDMADDGDIVLVSNGVYAAGGRLAPGGMLTNRLVVTNAVDIRSVNGPSSTVIEGAADSFTGGNGTNAIRCTYLANKATLIGFTLTHGATRTTGDYGADNSGGAVWCDSTNVVVSNCVINGNSAHYGGGVYKGTLKSCVLLSNSAVIGGGTCDSDAIACIMQGNTASNWAGGMYIEHDGMVEGCTIKENHAGNFGGGVLVGGDPSRKIWNCQVIGNSAGDGGGGVGFLEAHNCVVVSNTAIRGGGAGWSTLFNCALSGNTAERGGGTFYSTVENCTVAGNHAVYYGGGSIFGDIRNSILVGNTASNGVDNYYDVQLTYCCTVPDPGGTGNFTGDPVFINYTGGNLRLLSNSPCVNAGTNQIWMTGAVDLDGNPRIFGGGRVDIGAYEYQGSISIIPTNWLAEYGLPIDGSADNEDEDEDTMSNWREWRCGTIPLNPDSFFAMERSSTAFGFPIVTWRTVYGRGYWVQRNTDLVLGAWSNLSVSPIYELDEYPEGIESMIDFTTSTSSNVNYRILLE